MIISLIVAMAENRVIGNNNQLPWHFPADLKYFKSVTLGKPVIMGRKTFLSIGKPLPGRHNIVLSQDLSFKREGITVVNSIDAALNAAGDVNEVMIIGGSQIFQQCLAFANKIYLTVIHHAFEGDAYFPELDHARWHLAKQEDHVADVNNPYAYSFYVYTEPAVH